VIFRCGVGVFTNCYTLFYFFYFNATAVGCSAEKQYFILRHEELASLSIDVENGESPAVGKALVIRRRAKGLSLYEDKDTGAVRTADGDLCVHADQGLLRATTNS